MSDEPSAASSAAASFGTLTGDVSPVVSIVGLWPLGHPPSAISERTPSRVPPSTGLPSRRAQTPGGRNDSSGTAPDSRATPMAAGSSAAATAWRIFLRENGSFSVWKARYPTRRPGVDSAPVIRRGGAAGNQMSSARASNSASAFSSVATSRKTIRSARGGGPQ